MTVEGPEVLQMVWTQTGPFETSREALERPTVRSVSLPTSSNGTSVQVPVSAPSPSAVEPEANRDARASQGDRVYASLRLRSSADSSPRPQRPGPKSPGPTLHVEDRPCETRNAPSLHRLGLLGDGEP